MGPIWKMHNKDIVLIEWWDSKGMERWEYLDEIATMPPDLVQIDW